MYEVGGRKQRAQCAAFSGQDRGLDQSLYKPWAAAGAWFIGPKGENFDLLKQLVIKALDHQWQFRKNFYPSDPAYVDDEIRNSKSYQEAIEKTKNELTKMLSEEDKSILFFPNRYKVSSVCIHICNPAKLYEIIRDTEGCFS